MSRPAWIRCSLRLARGLARRRIVADDHGGALIELAVMMSLLGVPMLLGTVYTATLLSDSIQVANAAHAGAMYGMRSATFAGATSSIRTAAQQEANTFGANLTVTPTVFYACSNAIGGTQYTTQALATAGCTGGGHALEFIQVLASGSVTPLGSVPGLPSTFTLSSTSVMEVQE